MIAYIDVYVCGCMYIHIYIYIFFGVEGTGEWMNWEQYRILKGEKLALRIAKGGRVQMMREPLLAADDTSVLS